MEKIRSLPHQILLFQSPILSSKIRVSSVKPTKTSSLLLKPLQRPMQKRGLPQPLGRNSQRGATGARTVRVRISLRIAKRARSMQLFKTPKSERNPRMLAISERNLRMRASRMGANTRTRSKLGKMSENRDHSSSDGTERSSWNDQRWKRKLTKRVTAEILKTDVIVDERRV